MSDESFDVHLSAERRREVQRKLCTRITQEEARLRYKRSEADCLRILGVSDGFLRAFDRDIFSKMQPGDEIWLYDSTPEEWQNMCGEKGLALVRNGKVLSLIVEARN